MEGNRGNAEPPGRGRHFVRAGGATSGTGNGVKCFIPLHLELYARGGPDGGAPFLSCGNERTLDVFCRQPPLILISLHCHMRFRVLSLSILQPNTLSIVPITTVRVVGINLVETPLAHLVDKSNDPQNAEESSQPPIQHTEP